MVPYEYYLLYKDLSYRPEYHSLMLTHCGLYIFSKGSDGNNDVRALGEIVRSCHRSSPKWAMWALTQNHIWIFTDNDCSYPVSESWKGLGQ